MYDPCGHLNNTSPWMKEGECTKHFPKQVNDGTVINVDGYPIWVVPYNPFLCKKYMAHITLEECVPIKSVRYLYKYIYKGCDTAHIEINERIDHDKVTTILDARYVSAPEATWRSCEFPKHT
ncbi:uncharacterized protein LOC130648026 [Hydractinia symbiolongicarpus]|uniref:uncharacterized protein LOC130648026 n=1 Tax=Hydractinia symbiolongicarpus TaxID=13093 RepID=UPI00254FBCC5|nr:uncharacterized protein LOC130648026 [Hydractinia symbiolongicarpus]